MERYPERLVNAVLRAIRKELEDCNVVHSLEVGLHLDEAEPFQLHPGWYENIRDAYSGVQLPPDKVAAARSDEMGFMRKLKVWHFEQPFKKFLGLNWQQIACDQQEWDEKREWFVSQRLL